MASIADSSVGSVPLAKLAELQRDLLQDRRDAPEAMTAPAIVVHANEGGSKEKDGSVEPVIPESANAYQTPHSSSQPRPRTLASSKSAPAGEMEAMIEPSPSQEAFTAMTRASSFHGYPAGDTQPMESQVYRDFRASMSKPAAETPVKRKEKIVISPDGKICMNVTKETYDTNVVEDKTQHTCVEGDTGFIDLEGAWQGEEAVSPTAQSSSSNVDELLQSPGTQLQQDDDTARPFAMPETPSVAGNKHNRDGEIIPTSATTESKSHVVTGFSQLFGGDGHKGAVLSATQLFDHTQAPSSPLPTGLRSDPVVTRPSPNLNHQYSMSSPAMTMSSPAATMHNGIRPPSTAGEPRETYTSMKESQERRAAKLRQELGLQSRFGEDIDEEDGEEEMDAERRIQRKRMQRVMSDQALSEFAKVRVSARPRSRPTSSPKRMQTIDLVTPATVKQAQPFEFDVSDDGNMTDEEDVEPTGAAFEDIEDADLDPDDIQDIDEDDVYDELGQTVVRSQVNQDEDQDADEERDAMSMKNDQVEIREMDDEVEQQDDHLDVEQQQMDAEDAEDNDATLPDTQPSAVADSQPSQHRDLSHPQQSSMLSRVPASQYTGRPSQNEAQASSIFSRFVQPAGLTRDDSRMRSSPPLVVANSNATAPDDANEVSAVLKDPRDQIQLPNETSHHAEQEIPESDFLESDAPQASSRPATATVGESNSLATALFSTARPQVSESGPSPGKTLATVSPLKSQQSKIVSQSPRTAAGVRRFADIEATATPRASGETSAEVDIDAIMSDVVTAEDQQYIDVVSSPPRERPMKRRKLMRAQSSMQSMEAEETAKNAHVAPVVQALRDSPSKANELRAVTPPLAEPSDETPDSVKSRETAGAKAASQLLSKRPKSTVRTSSKLSANSKRSVEHVNGEKSAKPTAEELYIDTEAPPKKQKKSTLQNMFDDVAKRSGRIIDETELDLNNPVRVPVQSHEDADDADQVVDPTKPEVRAPARVFALFKGTYNAFYPATWLASSSDGLTASVRFDDGTVTSIDAQQIRRLDLKIGDVVKVDGVGMKKSTWVVQGFGPVVKNREEKETDVYGREVVKVQAKSTRSSLPAKAYTEGETVDVAVANVYLTHTLWTHFTDREFFPLATTSTTVSTSTPIPGLHTPETAETPGSRGLRRSIIPTTKAKAARISSLREDAAAVTPIIARTNGLFSGMAFAISYGSNEAEKAEVTRSIQRNGGLILEQGFDELFSVPSLDDTSTSPSPSKADREATPSGDGDGDSNPRLKLKPEFQSLGFVALIADKHSRRAKYMQALALGLPTVSGKWIADTLDPTKNTTLASKDAKPLPWTSYLLAAGESAYLGGAIRSRSLTPYSAADAKLANTIANHDLLMNNEGVLIVAPTPSNKKASKGTWERRKAYAFLTLALGAGRVRRVADLVEAKKLVSTDPAQQWKWIYVDGDVEEAQRVVLGGKKRKRDADGNEKMAGRESGVRIVDDEFVVQSLILGDPVD